MSFLLYFLAIAIGANCPVWSTVQVNSTEPNSTVSLPSFDVISQSFPVFDKFLDRVRMGLIDYDERNTSLKIVYNETPFERILYEIDIDHMVKLSARDTKHIIRPYHYHRFQLDSDEIIFRIHCKFMLNFISLGNKTWENEFRLATNLMSYYRRLYENGSHTDIVCYFVDAFTQKQANCLLHLVSDPLGEPFPVVEYSHVHRNRHLKEPKVSHYHPHNSKYLRLHLQLHCYDNTIF